MPFIPEDMPLDMPEDMPLIPEDMPEDMPLLLPENALLVLDDDEVEDIPPVVRAPNMLLEVLLVAA